MVTYLEQREHAHYQDATSQEHRWRSEDDALFVKGLKVGAKVVILEFFMSDGLIKSFSLLSKGQQTSMMVTRSLVLMTMSGRTEEPLLRTV